MIFPHTAAAPRNAMHIGLGDTPNDALHVPVVRRIRRVLLPAGESGLVRVMPPWHKMTDGSIHPHSAGTLLESLANEDEAWMRDG